MSEVGSAEQAAMSLASDGPATYGRYLRPSDDVKEVGLVCIGAGWQRVNRIQFESRVLNCYGIMAVTKGSGWFSWGPRQQNRFPVRAPAAFGVFPGVRHSYQPNVGGWSERWVLFQGEAVRGYERLGVLDRDNPVMQIAPVVRRVTRVFDELTATVSTRTPHRDVMAASLVHHLLALLLAGKGENDASWITRYLDDHAHESLLISEHAARLGLDEDSLRTIVRRSTGCSPKDYILRVRLERAKELLAATDLKVADIARRTGFNDPAYFTRLFTRRVGEAPLAFRSAESGDRTS